MRNILYAIVAMALSLASQTALAQQVENFQQEITAPQEDNIPQAEKFRMQLAEPDSLSGARSNVTIHFSAEEAIGKYNSQTSPKESYQGYRIRIFSSNSQTARTDAEAAIELFEQHYAVPVYFAYENPYFLVTCGNCLSHDEAIMLLSKVRIHFPKAFIVMSEIPAETLSSKPIVPQAPNSENLDGTEPTTSDTNKQQADAL